MATKNWQETRNKRRQDPTYDKRMAEARAEVETEAAEYFNSLAVVRRARDFTQEELAELLGIKQTSVSKIERSHERHADLYVSTLRRFIEAMGGQLKISAVFPDGVEVPIDNFRQIDSSNSEVDSQIEEKTPGDELLPA